MRGVSTKTPERVERARVLREAGLSYAAIGCELDIAATCVRAWLTGDSSTPYVRRYRSDPERRERDREVSRRWKREHLGQPGKPKAAA